MAPYSTYYLLIYQILEIPKVTVIIYQNDYHTKHLFYEQTPRQVDISKAELLVERELLLPKYQWY